jgi:ankyrin repeat protein
LFRYEDFTSPDFDIGKALLIASFKGHGDVIELLVRRKTSTLSYPDAGLSLHFAAMNSHEVIVRRLLENGADASYRPPRGHQPLQHAAASGSIETIKVLLKHGASPSGRGSHGVTALHQKEESVCQHSSKSKR